MRHFITFFVGLMCLKMCSCSVGVDHGSGNSLTGLGNDVLLVSQESDSPGFRLVRKLSGKYPQLDSFVKSKGPPRFAAYAEHHESRYLIMYYLNESNAYVCKGDSGLSKNAVFIGPFPIQDEEIKILRRLEQRGYR